MPEPAMLDYFYGDEAEQYTFYRIPKVLFTDPAYRRISSDAKILYGLMLDRMGLSVRNGWLDDCQRVFIYFTLEDALEYLCCGHTKAVSLFAELDKGGLIERKKQGQGKPTKIYVKNFVRKAEVLTSEKRKSKVPQTGSQDFQKTYSNNTDINNTELNDTDPSIYPDRGLPEDRPPAAADTMDTMGAYREIIKENIEYQKLGKELMSVDELAVMPSSRCIVQVQGVRPFYSKKFDLTKHPQYKYTADANPKYAFDVKAYLAHRLKTKPDDEFEVYDLGEVTQSEPAA